MLPNIKFIPHTPHTPDSFRMIDSIKQLPDQCQQVIHEISQQHIPSSCSLVDNIVVSGMGGSALGGRIIQSLERQVLRVPIVISTEFHLPNFVGPKSLVVISSYSGNTEETLASFREAQARDAQIYIITSGGQLADIAHDHNIPHYIFNPIHNPCGQPRMGLGYNALAILVLLAQCQLIHPLHDLSGLPDFLRSRQSNFPKLEQLAHQMQNRIPILVASEHLKGTAHSFKNQLNENAKTVAAFFDLPELNHHLLEGLTYPDTNSKNLFFLFFESAKYHSELIKRYPVTESVVKKQRIPYAVLTPEGPNRLYEAMDLLQSGSYVAYYLALLMGIDPGPIPWVDWYKHEIR